MINGSARYYEKRKFYRILTEIPATVFPFFDSKEDKEKEEFYETTIVDLSGAGVKLYSEEVIPYSKKVLIKFSLADYEAEIICRVVKRYEEDKNFFLALAFEYPYQIPTNVVNPKKWMEDKIAKYVFQRQIIKKAPIATKHVKRHRTYYTKED